MQLFAASFALVPDARAENTQHKLVEVLFIAFVAALCGAQHCTEMAEFGRAKQKLFKKLLTLKHGIPSHDTFSTVFRLIDPKALDAAFRTFMAAFGKAIEMSGVVAIDGKSLKRAYDKGKAHMPRMMVSAFAAEMRLTLASVAAKDGNEIEAALEVLGLIDLKGTIVTADALHCHRKMAARIVERGGDYCLALKGNQDSLLSDARACLSKVEEDTPVALTTDRGHGRVETRRAVVIEAPGIAEHHEFPGLEAFGRIEAVREINGKRETETRIYALSKEMLPDELLRVARAHWQIENALHWELDVVMGEDAARNRKDNGPENLAVLRRLALNVARADTSKGSLSAKLKRAGWDEDFLLKLLGHMR